MFLLSAVKCWLQTPPPPCQFLNPCWFDLRDVTPIHCLAPSHWQIKIHFEFKMFRQRRQWQIQKSGKYSNYSGRGVGGGCFRVATPNVDDDIVKVTIGAIASLCKIGAASATSTLSSFVSRRCFVLDSIGFDYARSKFILTCLTGKSVQAEHRIIQLRLKRRVFCMYLNVFFQSPHNTVRAWHAYGER